MSNEKEIRGKEGGVAEVVVDSEVNKQELFRRLDSWVNERPMRKQRQVRKNIATALKTDALDPVGSENVPRDVVVYRGHVDTALALAIGRLSNKTVQHEIGVVAISPKQYDKITGVHFVTIIRRVEGAWVSEEVSEQGKVISQAVVSDSGGFELTLNYAQLSDEENPSLKNDSCYPTGTKVLFVNHSASLGVISWSGK